MIDLNYVTLETKSIFVDGPLLDLDSNCSCSFPEDTTHTVLFRATVSIN
jgi:hypothetical protein